MDTDRAGSDVFAVSRQCFDQLVGFLGGDGAGGLTHAELEDQLAMRGRELVRQLFQDHLDLRALREARRDDVVDAAGMGRGAVEADHRRGLTTVFGEVTITRLAYRRRGHANLHPADAGLNLPAEKYSHGLRRLAAIEASRGSFDAAVDALERACGQQVGKRQVEGLAAAAVVDFETFYTARQPPAGAAADILVLSADGKGIVMRPDALRPATRKAAEGSKAKLASRLSKGEKRGRKRMAEDGAVYDITPTARSPADVMASHDDHETIPAPVATGKWLTASVVDNAAEVVARLFDEAERRDPGHTRTWVALVDGNNHQIDRIHTEACDRGVEVTIVIDFIHVLEYLWGAAWSFFDEGDPAAETWVADKAAAVLAGNARHVATGIRRRATRHRLQASKRINADRCATYLTNKAGYLDYPTALASGWPIATGVIEGACRHLVKDRMDLTGTRWSLDGAQAILKLRALRSNGDFDDYWSFHLAAERQRVHESRYVDNVIPQAS